jgi:hypothetical protein
VIFLFMQGGPSQVDTFDPKPLLNRLHGPALPPSVSRGLQPQVAGSVAARLGSRRPFAVRAIGQRSDTIRTCRPVPTTWRIRRAGTPVQHAPAQY